MIAKSTLAPLAVKTLITCRAHLSSALLFVVFFAMSLVSFSAALAAPGRSDEIPAGFESYLSRPDILEMPAVSRVPTPEWQALKKSQFAFVAELLALYPSDYHFYFLARDSEHLYDIARLVTEGKKQAQNIHLLNVSSANMRDSRLGTYLKENGITEARLQEGLKVLFVDTGFSGTIPRTIGELFSEQARASLKTHLIVSNNPSHPSSRAFLAPLNSNVNLQLPSQMQGAIYHYEQMPRYTDRSTFYAPYQGRMHPLSPQTDKERGKDGALSKEESRLYMSDLKATWQQTSTQQEFAETYKMVSALKKTLASESPKALFELRQKLATSYGTSSGIFLEALVRDVIESSPNAELEIRLLPVDLGLPLINGKHEMELFLRKYPRWNLIFQDPQGEAQKLARENNWELLKMMKDFRTTNSALEAQVREGFTAFLVSLSDPKAVLSAKKGLFGKTAELSPRDRIYSAALDVPSSERRAWLSNPAPMCQAVFSL